MPYYKYAENNPSFPENLECSSCDKSIEKKQAVLVCTYCGKCFHPACKKIYGEHINRAAANTKWTCSNECNTGLSGNKPEASTSTLNPTLSRLDAMSKNFDEQFKVLNQRIDQVIKSQEFLSNKFDTIQLDISKLEDKNLKLSVEVEKLKQSNEVITNEVYNLEACFDKLKQIELQKDMILAGLPDKDRPAMEVVKQVLKKYTLESIEPDIESALYIEQKSNVVHGNKHVHRPSDISILVKFSNYEAKQALFREKQKNKFVAAGELGFSDEAVKEKPIFVRHHLSPFQKSLYREAIEIKRQYNWKYLWVSDSCIFRKVEGSKVYKIQVL